MPTWRYFSGRVRFSARIRGAVCCHRSTRTSRNKPVPPQHGATFILTTHAPIAQCENAPLPTPTFSSETKPGVKSVPSAFPAIPTPFKSVQLGTTPPSPALEIDAFRGTLGNPTIVTDNPHIATITHSREKKKSENTGSQNQPNSKQHDSNQNTQEHPTQPPDHP